MANKDKEHKFTVYEHHGESMVVRKDLIGQHRDYCLCYSCKKFLPQDRENNCKIANLLFALDQHANIVTPVWECAECVIGENGAGVVPGVKTNDGQDKFVTQNRKND
jgi:hypothetical protein